MWSIARIDLALSEEEFLAMNYRRFTILYRRYRRLQWQREYVQGCIASAIYYTGFSRPNEVPKPDLFCFTSRPGEQHRSMERMSRKDIASVFRALAARPATGKGKKVTTRETS
jgi:hypothetical protein